MKPEIIEVEIDGDVVGLKVETGPMVYTPKDFSPKTKGGPKDFSVTVKTELLYVWSGHPTCVECHRWRSLVE